MFLPVGDEPNPEQTPWATYLLMAGNLAVWLFVCVPLLSEPLSFSMPGAVDYVDMLKRQTGHNRLDLLGGSTAFDLLMFRWGYRPDAPNVLALVTSMFLHGGWMHLAGNMLFLYIFGDNVEARLGPLRYLLTYLATGIVATLFYAAFRVGSPFPLVGASGAISGVLGCYFVWFPRNRVKVLYSIFFFIERAMVPARVVLLFYLLLENLLPFLLSSAGGGSTAYGAHIGGFVAGAAFAYYDAYHPRPIAAAGGAARAPRRSSPFDAVRDVFERSQSRRDFAAAARAEDVTRLVTSRQYADAAAMYRALPLAARTALGAETCFALADYLTEQQRFDEALRILRQHIGPRVANNEICARAHLRMGLIYLRGLKRPPSAYPHLLDVLDLRASEPVAQAARAALGEVENPAAQPPWSRR